MREAFSQCLGKGILLAGTQHGICRTFCSAETRSSAESLLVCSPGMSKTALGFRHNVRIGDDVHFSASRCSLCRQIDARRCFIAVL